LGDPEGDLPGMNGDERSQSAGVTPPSPAEQRPFKLLPLAWVGVLVLAAVILYLVFT
jgi:hypothetical protein